MTKSLAPALARISALLEPQRDELLLAWLRTQSELHGVPEGEARPGAEATLRAFFGLLGRSEVDAFLLEEDRVARRAAREGGSLLPQALAIRAFDRVCQALLLAAGLPPPELAELLVAFEEFSDRRHEALLGAQEEESARRLVDAQEQAAQAAERARELRLSNEELRRAQARSQHRAEQVALLSSVMQSVAGVLDPERLLQEAAAAIRSARHYSYVAVVVLDHEGVLVGRWAGRPGLDRRSGGRAQGPVKGIIGRALRKRAPQLVPDVRRDPDYLADVHVTRSELAVPLIDEGEVVGAIDLQSEREAAFDLEDVAAGEAIADFLVVALRNARLVAALRSEPGPGR